MFDFIKRCKKRRLAAQYFRGWDFAAGHLLSHGEAGIEYLENCVGCAKHFHDYTEFDKGIESALVKYARYTTFPKESHEDQA